MNHQNGPNAPGGVLLAYTHTHTISSVIEDVFTLLLFALIVHVLPVHYDPHNQDEKGLKGIFVFRTLCFLGLEILKRL